MTARRWALVLALAAGCARMHRDDLRGSVLQSDLSTVFMRCGRGRVVRSARPAGLALEPEYLVFACGQVATYLCEPPHHYHPTCTLEAFRRSHAEDVSRLKAARGGRRLTAADLGVSHADDRAEADQLFWRGRELARKERYAEACALFVRSDALVRTFGTAINLADCALRSGDPAHAAQLYDAAASIAARDGLTDQAAAATRLADDARRAGP